MAGLVAVFFSSCKKEEYLCSCYIIQGGANVVKRYELGKITNGSAQGKCNQIQLDIQNNGRQGTASCKVELDQ